VCHWPDCLGELHEHDGFPQTGYILRGERGDSLNLDNLSRRLIAPTLKAVGIEWRGYYSLRRGCATMATVVARDRGLAAKGLLRHASLTTTAAHYIDSVPSETREAVEEVGRLFQNCSKELMAQSASATKQN
jgi:integrase